MNAYQPPETDPVSLATLDTFPVWVAWQTECREGSADPTKIPYVSKMTKARANAGRWLTREQAEKLAHLLPKPEGAGGIGLEFFTSDDGRSVAGIDLDSCRDPATGSIEAWALDVIEVFDSYTEISPSGTGAKTFFTFDSAELPRLQAAMGTKHGKAFKRGSGKHPRAIELHLGNRYFTVTEELLDGMPLEFRHIDAGTILDLILRVGPEFSGKGGAGRASPPPGADPAGETPHPDHGDDNPDLLARIEAACQQKRGLAKRWNGDWSGIADQSGSGRAFTLGAALKRAGFSCEDMIDALLMHSGTREWASTKGQADDQRELLRIWKNVKVRGGAGPGGLDDGSDIAYPLTEGTVADSFRDDTEAGAKDWLRYDHTVGRWFEWTDANWRREETKLAYSWAHKRARFLAAELGDPDDEKRAGKASFAAGVERIAQSDRAFAVTHETWDRNPWLLGTPGGVVDLQTGRLRPADRGDFITKLTTVTPAEPGTAHPLWSKFLAEATLDDEGLQRFLQQIVGYCLTGITREHALFFVHGGGGNGKGVFLNTVATVLGAYATTAAMDTFTASQSDRHPTDLAGLAGARMVAVSETEEGRAWAESRIKALTGGDKISARFMRQDFFEYTPAFKLMIVGNHKPVLRNVDEAARRRFNIIPFVHKPPVKDQHLEAKLRAEFPAILAWAVAGCLDWQANGLTRPAVVTEATAEYFSEQDSIKQWAEECCDIGGRNVSDTTANLFASWMTYATANGEKPGTTKWFTQAVLRLGGDPVRETPGHRGKRGFLKITVKPVDTSNQWWNRHEAAQ